MLSVQCIMALVFVWPQHIFAFSYHRNRKYASAKKLRNIHKFNISCINITKCNVICVVQFESNVNFCVIFVCLTHFSKWFCPVYLLNHVIFFRFKSLPIFSWPKIFVATKFIWLTKMFSTFKLFPKNIDEFIDCLLFELWCAMRRMIDIDSVTKSIHKHFVFKSTQFEL